ncbi:hypothetical protein [Nitrosopumilus sp.]|nr:hypothetical protein [Nitrosopumilus sp.]MCV0431537.1 hypothetical protein [Nitrosopumilus sp.]
MKTTQKTIMFDSHSEYFLDAEMTNLLEMTNETLLKIKLRAKEIYP